MPSSARNDWTSLEKKGQSSINVFVEFKKHVLTYTPICCMEQKKGSLEDSTLGNKPKENNTNTGTAQNLAKPNMA